MEKKHQKETGENQMDGVVGGILKGFTDLVEKLGDLAETGERLSKSKSFSDADKGVQGEYAFSVKVGLNKEKDTAFHTSSTHTAHHTPQTPEVREPQVDVFDEADCTLIVAEMPGITAEDLHIDLQEDRLVFSAEYGQNRYYKEIRLPKPYQPEQIRASYNNGIVEIRCFKSPVQGQGHGQNA